MALDIDVVDSGSSKFRDSDLALSAQIALQWMLHMPLDGIKVRVDAGWVTLSGELDWEHQREAAIGGMRDLAGVAGVSDRIALKPTVPSSTIRSDIELALKCHVNGHAQHISVAVRGDNVTLSGTVPTWLERDAAANSAWGTAGVRNVVDHIRVS